MKKTILLSVFCAVLCMNNIMAQVVFSSDFETWTGVQAATDWSGSKSNFITTAGDSARRDSIGAYHGKFCVDLVNTTTTAKRFCTKAISITAGDVYTMRFWAKGAGSVRTGLYGVRTSTSFGFEYCSYITVATPTWTVYTQTLMADSTNTNAQFLFSVKSTLAASGNLQIDSVTITNIGPAKQESLYNIQYTLAVPANSPYLGQFVTTSGVVTAVGSSAGVQSGYFVQTTNAHAWSAVFVYDFTPVTIGDSISFSGFVEEYFNETELAQVCGFKKWTTGNVIVPTVVAFGGPNTIQQEKYEGLLVKVKDVTDVRYNSLSAWYVFSDSTSSGIDTVDNNCFTYAYTQNKKYNITGVVHFEYAMWLEPRNINDIDSINVSAGIKNYKNEFTDLTIYPNPNSGAFTVSVTVTGDAKNTDVTLTDLAGRLIYKEQRASQSGTGSFQVNTAGLDKGIYFLELSTTEARTVKKVIVQ